LGETILAGRSDATLTLETTEHAPEGSLLPRRSEARENGPDLFSREVG